MNIAPNPQQPYVGAAAFAHKAGLHTSAIARRRDAYEHVAARRGRQRHPLRRVGAGRAVDPGPQGRGARPRARLRRARPGARHAEGPRAPRLPLRGGRRLARAAAAPGDGVGAGRSSRWSRSGSSPTTPTLDQRAHTDRGDVKVAHRRRAAWWPPPRATGPSTPSTRRCARPSAPHFPVLRRHPPRRLPGAGPRHRPGHGGGHPGAHRHHRRRARVDDDRGVGEHHRGLLAGPVRLDRLRSRPRRPAGAPMPGPAPAQPRPRRAHR